jgi:hypothetical protein
VVGLAAGEEHSLFLKQNGTVWAMGRNSMEQLGDGFTSSGADYPEQIHPPTQPRLSVAIPPGGKLEFTATCQFGGTYYLLESTNLTLPRSQWSTVATNYIFNRASNIFSATLTNAVSPDIIQKFYVLQAR